MHFDLSIDSINQIDVYWTRDDRASKVSGGCLKSQFSLLHP